MNDIFFTTSKWRKYTNKIISKLEKESVLITGLPQVGINTFLCYFRDIYEARTKTEKNIVITLELYRFNNIPDIQTRIIEIINQNLGTPKSFEGLSVEDILRKLSVQGFKILFILYRIDNLVSHPYVFTFFQTLRAINPLLISFLSTADISCLTSSGKYAQAGPLASTNIELFPLLKITELKETIKRFEDLYSWEVPEANINQIFELSGGVRGLCKYICKYINDYNPKTLDPAALLEYSGIGFRTKEIYNKLVENDLIRKGAINRSKQNILERIGTIDKKGEIRIQLIKPYLKRALSTEIERLKDLSNQERSVFEYFRDHSDKIITVDDLARILWGDAEKEKFSLWAIYKMISNLNRKIKNFGFEITNYRGRGYQIIPNKQTAVLSSSKHS
ncbi:MAG: helix-turn-helix domain-containing protein [Candidatus Dojkabacteria bacterium]|nr:helix-turn-helix domain-containing protein [Candidatus Dojkabacteria bacterium]